MTLYEPRYAQDEADFPLNTEEAEVAVHTGDQCTKYFLITALRRKLKAVSYYFQISPSRKVEEGWARVEFYCQPKCLFLIFVTSFK